MNILLGVTGSVATIKLPKLITGLQSLGDVNTIVTASGMKFVEKIIDHTVLFGKTLVKNSDLDTVFKVYKDLYTDEDEWEWNQIGDKVLHVELAEWADVMVIAPLTANTLAKMANGMADNLLLCTYLALGKKKLILAPAMNTNMWNHPNTQWNTFRVWPIPDIIEPVEKKLACGTTGIGAMADIETIVNHVSKCKETHESEEYVK